MVLLELVPKAQVGVLGRSHLQQTCRVVVEDARRGSRLGRERADASRSLVSFTMLAPAFHEA